MFYRNRSISLVNDTCVTLLFKSQGWLGERSHNSGKATLGGVMGQQEDGYRLTGLSTCGTIPQTLESDRICGRIQSSSDVARRLRARTSDCNRLALGLLRASRLAAESPPR